MRNERVLVVDDEPLVADTLGLIFRRRGFDCQVAYSGAEAIERVRSFTPSLLLLDLNMPGMSGLEVARSLAVSHPECRLLMMTGHYSKLPEAHEYASGLRHPIGFATKPVQPDALLQQASSMLAAV